MARKISVTLADDIDGSEGTETVSFGLDGTRYEIDLNLEHARELRKLVAPFIEKARKVPDPSARLTRSRRSTVSDSSSREIRDWARARGRKVNKRGRIPADVAAEYEREKILSKVSAPAKHASFGPGS